jgi:FkbM family methyltransferase
VGLTAIKNTFFRLGFFGFALEASRRGLNLGRAVTHKRLFGARYYEKQIHDYRLVLDLHDPGISTQLMIKGSREPEHRYILQEELKPGMTVFDLGANIGYYSVMMGKIVGREGRVYAVEPFLPNFQLLNMNIKLNGLDAIVESYNLGIAKETGLGKLYVSEKSNWHTFFPVDFSDQPAWVKKYTRKFMGPVDVQTMSIWDFVQSKRRIALIRMDIEGYEVEVLEGLIPRLAGSDFEAKILLETHPEFYHERTHDMQSVLHALFTAGGYTVKYLVSDGHYGNKAGEFFRRQGYPEENIVKLFRRGDRAIYKNISHNDAIEFISRSELVHAALLERRA